MAFKEIDAVRDPMELKAWVARVLTTDTAEQYAVANEAPVQPGFSFDLIAGDASPRKYHRIGLSPSRDCATKTWIAVDAPSSEKTPEFLHVRALFEAAGVRVPQLIAADPDAGFLLLEDLGDETLLPFLSARSADSWYAMALNTLTQLAEIPVASSGLVHYDGSRLLTELQLFRDWFVPKLLGLPWTSTLEAGFTDLCNALIDSATEQPQRVVHRDFHSRNLMVVDKAELAVIDFQDAVIGPITYDPVSLLKDCYVHWPRKQQMTWLFDHKRELVDRQSLSLVDDAIFLRWFDLMGLQRHLKVLGIFARLCLRDGKPGYLNDLSLVLAYVLQALNLYAPTSPAVARFEDVFLEIVLPACTTQPWYRQVALS